MVVSAAAAVGVGVVVDTPAEEGAAGEVVEVADGGTVCFPSTLRKRDRETEGGEAADEDIVVTALLLAPTASCG